MDDEFGVSAGWYPDPLGLPQLRWWDSQAWTEHTSEARAPIFVHPTTVLGFADDDEQRVPVQEGEEFLSRREQRARERRENGDVLQATPDMEIEAAAIETASESDIPLGLDVDEVKHELSAQPLLAMTLRELEPPLTDTVDDVTPGPTSASNHSDAVPMEALLTALSDAPEAEEQQAPARAIKKVKTYTAAVWAIALMPLFQVALSIVFVTALGLGSNWPLMIAVIVLPYFVVLGLAGYDRLVLQVRGHTKPARGFWALLTAPVYLVVRAIRTWRYTGKGFATLALFAAAGVSVLVGVLVVPGTLISVMPDVFSMEAESSVRSAAVALGGEIDVDCPSPPVKLGEEFNCLATWPNGEKDAIRVGLERQNGWISWPVRDWGGWTIQR